MNSIIANIFLAVQERIKIEVPGIKWIDQDLGQLEYYTMGQPPVMYPAVLIDFPDTQYSDMSENAQIGDQMMELRLAVGAYTPSSHVSTPSQKANALEYYNLEHLLVKALHGWCDSGLSSPITRIGAQTERREDNIRVRVIRFKLALQDDTTMAVAYQTVPRPEMELDHQTK